MFFHILNRLYYLLDKKQDLILDDFPKLNEYKDICKRHENYNSTKASAVYKTFYVNSMIYHLFQNFPFNFLSFIESNHLTYREFTHGLKYIPFWYETILQNLVPKQNKLGREISESEVAGAIRYLQLNDKTVNQLEVAKILAVILLFIKDSKRFIKIYQ